MIYGCNMKFKPYEWQKRLLRIYRGHGVVKAFAGTGKTYATILLIKAKKYNNVLVAVPTKKLKNQWTQELENHEVYNATVETFHILCKERSKGISCDMFVVDECHRSTSPVFKNVYENIQFTDIIGLSATPNKLCLEYCGSIIIDVPLKEAKISDFIVYFHSIDLTYAEREQYEEYSESIGKWLGRFRRADEHEKWKFRAKLDSMIFKRRSLVYSAENRIPLAVELLKKNSDRPTLVICKRIDQADILSKITKYPVYHSGKHDENALDDFQNDRIPALLSVGMLTEGYDKRNIKCLIIVSTAITEAFHIQSIGRAVRLPDNADVHILLAKKTTDERLLQFRHMYKHKLVGNFSPRSLKPKNPWLDQYYLADEYHIDIEGRIYQKTLEGKQYFKSNSISSTLQRLFNYRAGNFRITKEELIVAKTGGKVVSLGMLSEPLEKIEPFKRDSIARKKN